MRPRRILLAAMAAGCAMLASACGEFRDRVAPPATQHPFSVVVASAVPDADDAPLYAAEAGGYLRAAGIRLHLRHPSRPGAGLKLLEEGKVDMAISSEPEVLLARDRGKKVVSVAALVQRPLPALISLPGQKIKSVKDLRGKQVGTDGSRLQAIELRTILQHAGVPPGSVRETDVGWGGDGALISGKVDAILSGAWNYEGIQLRLDHHDPRILPVNQAGLPRYEDLVLVVREQTARYQGERLRAFMQALSQGEREVRRSPPAAARLVRAHNGSLDQALQLRSIEATLPAALPAGKGKPYGFQKPGDWASFGSWMYKRGLLREDPDRKGLPPFSNEFLPGQGVGKAEEELL